VLSNSINRFYKPSLIESLLFFALISGPPRFRVRDVLASFRGEIDWNTGLDIFIWLVGGLWILHQINVHLLIQRTPLPRLSRVQMVGLILCASLTLSSLFAPSPFLSLYKIMQIIIMILFGHFWIHKYGVDSLVRHLLFAYIIIGVGILLTIGIAPELVLAANGRLRGDGFGGTDNVATLGFLLLMIYPSQSRLRTILGLSLFIFLLIAGRGRTGFVALILFMILVFLTRTGIPRLRRLRYVVIFAMPFVLVFVELILGWWIRGDVEAIATFTGRTTIWSYFTELVMTQSPVLGFGFFSDRAFTIDLVGVVGSSHSAYIAILVGGGLLSSILFGIAVIILSYFALKLFLLDRDNPNSFSAAILLMTVLVFAIITEGVVVAGPIGFTFYMLFSLIPVLLTELNSNRSRQHRQYTLMPIPVAHE
jgi:hypothetical protein